MNFVYCTVCTVHASDNDEVLNSNCGQLLLHVSDKSVTVANCYYRTLFMAALCNTAGHYIFAMWFLSFSIFLSFPCLISAAADWMSTILPHMVWP